MKSSGFLENEVPAKSQLIWKCLFCVFNFFQKTNENTSHSSKVEFIRSFFGRIHGLTICFRVLLTFRVLPRIRKWSQLLNCMPRFLTFGLELCFKCSSLVYLLKFNWFEQKRNTICLLKTEFKTKKLFARNRGMQIRSWLHIRGALYPWLKILMESLTFDLLVFSVCV